MPLTIILIHMTSKMTNNMSAQSFCSGLFLLVNY